MAVVFGITTMSANSLFKYIAQLGQAVFSDKTSSAKDGSVATGDIRLMSLVIDVICVINKKSYRPDNLLGT